MLDLSCKIVCACDKEADTIRKLTPDTIEMSLDGHSLSHTLGMTSRKA